jgi:hypothetical protein
MQHSHDRRTCIGCPITEAANCALFSLSSLHHGAKDSAFFVHHATPLFIPTQSADNDSDVTSVPVCCECSLADPERSELWR